MTIEGIGELILTYRKRENLSLSELAERTGINKTSLSRIETGETKQPSFDLWKKVAHTLHIPYSEVIGIYLDATERPTMIKLLLEESIILNHPTLMQKAARKLLETPKIDAYLALDYLLQVTKEIPDRYAKLMLYQVLIDYTRKSGVPYYLGKCIYERYILERDDFTHFEDTYRRGKELSPYIEFLQPTERVDYYYRMGVHAYILEHYGESIEFCGKGIREDQSDNKQRASALISIVNSYLRLGDLIMAGIFLDMYEESKYADFRKKHLRALLLTKKGQHDEAIALYKECLQEAGQEGRITVVSDLLEACLEVQRNDEIRTLIDSESELLSQDILMHPYRIKQAARYYKRKGICLLAIGEIQKGLDSLLASITYYRQIGDLERMIECVGLFLKENHAKSKNYYYENIEKIGNICYSK